MAMSQRLLSTKAVTIVWSRRRYSPVSLLCFVARRLGSESLKWSHAERKTFIVSDLLLQLTCKERKQKNAARAKCW